MNSGLKSIDILAIEYFVEGRVYTRRQIRDSLGGDLQASLAHVGDKIVCGCFGKKFNPFAPDTVVVRRGKNTVRYALVLLKQVTPIPVFIGLGAGQWQFVGHYSARTYSEERTLVEANTPLVIQERVVGVLSLIRVNLETPSFST